MMPIHSDKPDGYFNASLVIIAVAFAVAVVMLLFGCAGRGLPDVSEVYAGLRVVCPNKAEIAVDGEVWRAGIVEWKMGMVAHDAIVSAGGRRPSGDERRVLVRRCNQAMRADVAAAWEGRPDGNFPVLPGDDIRVPPKWNVRVGRFFGGLLGLAAGAASLAAR